MESGITSNPFMGYYVIGIVFFVLSMIVSRMLVSKFKKFSKTPVRSGLTGREIAEKMLRESGVEGVTVISTPGSLSDHYNPLNRTVNLSPEVYNGAHVAAAAVAAHECGHAVQHAKSYAFLEMRSKLVPVISVSSKYMMWVILAGVLMINTFPGLLLAGIVMFGLTTLFSFVTLPVEFDASKRALVWLNESDIARGEEYKQARSALNWAASTYVVAALGSLATLLYYVTVYLGRR